jgi:hypothetical protein
MSEKRGQRGFVNVEDLAATAALQLISGSANVVPALNEATKEKKALSAQGRHHFDSARQIDALARIGEDKDPDMGFMTRMLTLCSLPRTDPGDRLQYKRTNGPYKLIMIAGGDNKLPFGNLPRLLLAWVCTEAVQTQSPKLNLGASLAAFMQRLGISSDSGGSRGDRTRLKDQIDRLFNAHIDLVYEDGEVKASTGGRLASKTVLWWDYHNPAQQTLWSSWIQLSNELFQEIIAHPIPIDIKILTAMRRSSLGFDLYLWLSYKTFSLYTQAKKPERLSWERLYRQFGSDPAKAEDKFVVRDFRKDALRELRKLKLSWPGLQVATPTGCLEIRGCPPSIAPKAITPQKIRL